MSFGHVSLDLVAESGPTRPRKPSICQSLENFYLDSPAKSFDGIKHDVEDEIMTSSDY